MNLTAEKILVTGATGQLGRAIANSVPENAHVVLADRAALNLTDSAAIERAIEKYQPTLLINAAAYTAVDKAESERALATQINAVAPATMARLMQQSDGRMIQLSTDFVFSGATETPWSTDAEPKPINHYGQSKLDGEQAVREILGDRASVVRTAWVYAPWGGNFVRSMLQLMAHRDQLNIVADQIGTPTSAIGLADFIWRLANAGNAGGCWHWTDAGVASWYDFAVAIQQLARDKKILKTGCEIVPIPASQYPTPARRPGFSVLDKTSTWQQFNCRAPHWRSALEDTLDAIKNHD